MAKSKRWTKVEVNYQVRRALLCYAAFAAYEKTPPIGLGYDQLALLHISGRDEKIGELCEKWVETCEPILHELERAATAARAHMKNVSSEALNA